MLFMSFVCHAFVSFHCCLVVTCCGRVGLRGGGGEGAGYSISFAYVGSDPASTVHPKKISGISSTPKNYLKF